MSLRCTSKDLNSCHPSLLRQNLDKNQNLYKQINSFHIPKEIPVNSQKIPPKIPKTFQKNPQKIQKKFQKNSKKIPKKSRKELAIVCP